MLTANPPEAQLRRCSNRAEKSFGACSRSLVALIFRLWARRMVTLVPWIVSIMPIACVGLLAMPLSTETSPQAVTIQEIMATPSSQPERLRDLARRLVAAAEAGEVVTYRSAASWIVKRLEAEPALRNEVAQMFAQAPHRELEEIGLAASFIDNAKRSGAKWKLRSLDGREFNSESTAGNIVILNFTGVTWCYACREEEKIVDKYWDVLQASGVIMLSVALELNEKSGARAKQILRERVPKWPYAIEIRNDSDLLTKRFGVAAVPQNFLFAKNGRLVATELRGEKLIARALELAREK